MQPTELASNSQRPQPGPTALDHPGRMRRVVNDLVLAEMFLVQATVESAVAIGDGLSELGRQLSTDDAAAEPRASIPALLQRTAGEALEPYTSRLKYLRQLAERDS